MAILVVAIHTSAYNCYSQVWINQVGAILVSLAVPFFFVCSGFLLWRKIATAPAEVQLERIKQWIRHVVQLYAVWTIVYLPYAIYGLWKEQLGFGKSIAIYLRNVILVGENYGSWPLWYLLALIMAGCILYVLIKLKAKAWNIYWIALFLAIIGSILLSIEGATPMPDNSIISLYFKVFKTARNGLFVGFPYIVIGIAIARHGILKSIHLLWLLLAVGVVCKWFNVPLVSFLIVYALFSLVLHYEPSRERDTGNIRLSSEVIYFVHMIWIGILSLWGLNIAPLRLFTTVVMLSLLTSYIVVRGQQTTIVKTLF